MEKTFDVGDELWLESLYPGYPKIKVLYRGRFSDGQAVVIASGYQIVVDVKRLSPA